MLCWGASQEQIQNVVKAASESYYGGNVVVKFGNPPSRNTVRFTLGVKSSKGKGARRSANGRKVAAACWHVHRDVLNALFAFYPGARVKTAMADYRGDQSFSSQFPHTGNVTIGGAFNQMSYRDACECEGQ